MKINIFFFKVVKTNTVVKGKVGKAKKENIKKGKYIKKQDCKTNCFIIGPPSVDFW